MTRKIDITKPNNQPIPWLKFELEVADYMEKTITDGAWAVDPKLTKVRRKPKYFSKSRGSDIIFDASVEICSTFDETKPIFIWLIECKDYPAQNVSVNEIEEFHSKMTQVGAHKGTVFTRTGFDSGAQKFAETHRIGLATLHKEEHLIIQFSQEGGVFVVDEILLSIHETDVPQTLMSLSDLLDSVLGTFGFVAGLPRPHRAEQKDSIHWEGSK